MVILHCKAHKLGISREKTQTQQHKLLSTSDKKSCSAAWVSTATLLGVSSHFFPYQSKTRACQAHPLLSHVYLRPCRERPQCKIWFSFSHAESLAETKGGSRHRDINPDTSLSLTERSRSDATRDTNGPALQIREQTGLGADNFCGRLRSSDGH